MTRRATPGAVAAVLACAGASVLLLRAATLPPPQPPLPRIAATVAVAENHPPAELLMGPPSPDSVADTLARPIFSATRRPPAPPAASALPTALPVPVGTVITADRRLVLLRVPGQARLVRVGAGDSVAGWRIAAVLADRVDILNAAGERFSLPLVRGPRPGPVPAAPIPPPGSPPAGGPPASETESDIVRTVEEIIRAANPNRAPRRRAGARRAGRRKAPPGAHPARPAPDRRLRGDL
jgi:general secretion pathway protein N